MLWIFQVWNNHYTLGYSIFFFECLFPIILNNSSYFAKDMLAQSFSIQLIQSTVTSNQKYWFKKKKKVCYPSMNESIGVFDHIAPYSTWTTTRAYLQHLKREFSTTSEFLFVTKENPFMWNIHKRQIYRDRMHINGGNED